VAQVVESQPSETRPGQERLKAARHASRRERTTDRASKDEIVLQPSPPGGESGPHLGSALTLVTNPRWISGAIRT
jgi:hypothetical protein